MLLLLVTPDYLIINILELNAVVEAMIQKVEDGSYECITCGKRMVNKTKMKRHSEVHLDMAHSCIVCGKIFKTRNALATHYTRNHGSEVVSPWTMK